ncbi:competence type IV pilus major pilin ComGC [Carnobacterium maltaromaticum]|uniref:competence type IV pilus major pilin ComGC n=1 Tax=Carnobacterium TaxID=2747 RepID=UPI0007050BF8|nr:competence type IV pilus major pilin ComGC [Carnobacterium maltaromaticum]KRN73419.1 hypothetical protein IV76_GL001965 [Carnobacterium maltaromaticum]MBC9789263.1 prepilin-type N-terminal cleavage/methylation domain-containing protein [Carnobacterium maltaromaticum]MDW5522890.1 competence type IV pilus major pilin ComGC [Carnobacterium maltaromaticum]CRH17758.1 Prepilin-type N-terminal cleavage/methylation domain protein [Carnobacterium maltaromaticum]
MKNKRVSHKKWKLNNKGFTLVEMILVLFVISVLLILVIPNVVQQKKKIDNQGTEALMTVIETQIELFLLEKEPGIEVSFAALKADNYLKQKQIDNAINKGLSIENNQVVQR